MHNAAAKGHMDIVELLIKHGANVNSEEDGVCALVSRMIVDLFAD